MIVSRKRPPKATKVFDSYWHFASERQKVYFNRLRGVDQPWTADPIISTYRFTNAYRASDRESQFLIKDVIYSGEQSNLQVFFRTILFRLFNKSETWRLLTDKLGALNADSFDVHLYSRILDEAMKRGDKIFSPAYIMPSRGPGFQSRKKHENLLGLLRRMIDDRLHEHIFLSTAEGAFRRLVAYPLIGNFLAYQFVTDLGYASNATYGEHEFVVPGPGALSGIQKCFSDLGDYSTADVIKWVRDSQHQSFTERGLSFETLWGRDLQLIDCQNLFCETDKYARVAHPESAGARTRIKRRFTACTHRLEPWYPPKWRINERIRGLRSAPTPTQGVLRGIV